MNETKVYRKELDSSAFVDNYECIEYEEEIQNNNKKKDKN
jgi:hypothetical protein